MINDSMFGDEGYVVLDPWGLGGAGFAGAFYQLFVLLEGLLYAAPEAEAGRANGFS